MFKKILAATDMVTDTDAPVLTAIALAKQYHAELFILHILESSSGNNEKRVKQYKAGTDMPLLPDDITQVSRELKKIYARELKGVDTFQFHVRTGNPQEKIPDLARRINTDLIVLGPHSGRTKINGVARVSGKIGSTVDGVVAREDCPVMIVNKPFSREQLSFERVVVGIDFSLSCECGLCFSVKLSRNFNSVLYPFFMIPVMPYPKATKSRYQANTETLRRKLEKFCETYLDGTDHEYQIWSGALPHLEVLKCAEKTGADLIILGSHTKLIEGKWYGGSVVERVSHGADCPVLVLNDPGALKKWEDIPMPDSQKKRAMDRDIHLFRGN